MWLAEGLRPRSGHRQGPPWGERHCRCGASAGPRMRRHTRWRWGLRQWSPEGLDGVGWEELHHHLEVVVSLDQWRGCVIFNVTPEERSSRLETEMLFHKEENEQLSFTHQNMNGSMEKIYFHCLMKNKAQVKNSFTAATNNSIKIDNNYVSVIIQEVM